MGNDKVNSFVTLFLANTTKPNFEAGFQNCTAG
jgi:hypothetical protein